ncbi:MAG: YggS family pyridoxal phosphate-dependent enzyme [Synergistaceae bacterium]|nr:YggS family pyridoxal phosphate-dependent enzyme [Synergistaceae bacterium]
MVMNMNALAIFDRIQNALSLAKRTDRVAFVAVSKTRTVDEMKQAEAFPCIDYFGENRVQEAESKRSTYGTSRIPWRLIGHLQANKARKAVELFDAIDSIDSIDLAQRVDRIAGELGKVMPVLIEVNTSGEASKSGIDPENFPQLAEKVMTLQNLRLDGLMTVGPLTDSEPEIRRAFAELRGLRENARSITGLTLPILSMGMSGDFELAIQEGSTMVRIGTLLFGARVYK